MTPTFYILHITLATILIATIAYYYHEATKAKEVGDLLKQAQTERKQANEYLQKARQDLKGAEQKLKMISSEKACLNKMESYLVSFLDDYDLYEKAIKRANPDIEPLIFINLKDDGRYYSKLNRIPYRDLDKARELIREHLAKSKP